MTADRTRIRWQTAIASKHSSARATARNHHGLFQGQHTSLENGLRQLLCDYIYNFSICLYVFHLKYLIRKIHSFQL